MKLIACALFLCVVSVAMRAQTISRAMNSVSEPAATNQNPASRAIFALKRLQSEVIVYASLAEFEDHKKLARVSIETFENDLHEVTDEVESLLKRLPQSRQKIEIRNALDSYRDGAFWWRKTYQAQVVSISALTSIKPSRPSDAAFAATIPYTVAIHWRQADYYLKRAESPSTKPGIK